MWGDVVFNFLINSYGAVALFVYLIIAISQVILRRRTERTAPGTLKLKMWLFPWLSYATIAATYWIFDYIAGRKAASAQPPADERIEVRDGGGAVFLSPTDVTHVEAAGNYVEFHTAAKTHLVRGTLASWEARLVARGFIRVHRSRLVNRAKITALKPTPSGDMEITLSENRTVLGSRRYRAVLTPAASA